MVPPLGRSYFLNASTWGFYIDHRNSYSFQSARGLRTEALMKIIWLLAHLIAKRPWVMVLGVWRVRWRATWARLIWGRVWLFIHGAVAVARRILNGVQRVHVSLNIPLIGKRDLLEVDKWMNHPYCVSCMRIINSRAAFELWRLSSLKISLVNWTILPEHQTWIMNWVLVIRRYS